MALISLGIGAIIGAGIFTLTGVAAAQHAGPGVVYSFIIAAIGCAFAGFCYSEFSTMIPIAGSAYTYAYATMGELLAWIIGWALVLEYAVGASTVAVSWSAYFASIMQDLGIHLPQAIVASPYDPSPGVDEPAGSDDHRRHFDDSDHRHSGVGAVQLGDCGHQARGRRPVHRARLLLYRQGQLHPVRSAQRDGRFRRLRLDRAYCAPRA
jgi:hypothetical protein